MTSADLRPASFVLPYLFKQKFRRLHVTSWGDPSAPPVVCVHGLSRNGRDFDALARDLAADHYVLCPDLPGRGGSDWLDDGADYQPLSYIEPLSHLLAHVGRPVSWVGTSLGGICGMVLGAIPGAPITRMVLNDIGPFIPAAALLRIRDYLGTTDRFADLAALTAHMRAIYASFGDLSDAQWADIAAHSARPHSDGGLTWHYDPRLTDPIRASEPADTLLWPFWNAITIPLLTLRGETSDLLLPETLAQMAEKSAVHTVPGCGHAPALMDAPTIAVLREFLTA